VALSVRRVKLILHTSFRIGQAEVNFWTLLVGSAITIQNRYSEIAGESNSVGVNVTGSRPDEFLQFI
jgi:hypothetical protein